MDIRKFRDDKTEGKAYAHFDTRVSLKNDKMWDYVRDAKSVAKHTFYPFISFKKDYTKYNHHKRKKKPKNRILRYASHTDRCIYQYYAFLIGEAYNDRVVSDGINGCSIAYRTNLGKSNIDFAGSAFDFIKARSDCYIIVGDFKGFFDNINHEYLKQQLCNLLQYSKLPDDQYAVFKSVTRYAFCDMDDILDFLGLKNDRKTIKSLNSKSRIMTTKEFHEFKKKSYRKENVIHYAVQKNKGDGIPQGSPISAVYANVYMLDFDKWVHKLIDAYFGMYMRYSDDFIVVLPGVDSDKFRFITEMIRGYINNIPGLTLELEKTQIYKYECGSLENISFKYGVGDDDAPKTIDYLGFSFDGHKITIRDKTISKYYYRMYRKINIVKYWFYRYKRLQTSSLYEKYSLSRSKKKRKGCAKTQNKKKYGRNFLTYVRDVYMKMGRNAFFERCIDRNMLKIRRRLDKVVPRCAKQK